MGKINGFTETIPYLPKMFLFLSFPFCIPVLLKLVFQIVKIPIVKKIIETAEAMRIHYCFLYSHLAKMQILFYVFNFRIYFSCRLSFIRDLFVFIILICIPVLMKLWKFTITATSRTHALQKCRNSSLRLRVASRNIRQIFVNAR